MLEVLAGRSCKGAWLCESRHDCMRKTPDSRGLALVTSHANARSMRRKNSHCLAMCQEPSGARSILSHIVPYTHSQTGCIAAIARSPWSPQAAVGGGLLKAAEFSPEVWPEVCTSEVQHATTVLGLGWADTDHSFNECTTSSLDS
jgi:hypothetical protein